MMKFDLYFERLPQQEIIMNYKHPDLFYKELINDNICNCDTIKLYPIPQSKDIDNYLLKSIEYRLANIIPNKVNHNIVNQKKMDMNIILIQKLFNR